MVRSARLVAVRGHFVTRANIRTGNAALGGLKSRLRALPVTLAHAIAQRAAPALAGLATGAYDGGRTVYGESRPTGVNGQPLDLEETGATRRTVNFSASGRIVRAALGTPYARYLIGKYRILPNGPLPVGWKQRIDDIVHTTKTDLK